MEGISIINNFFTIASICFAVIAAFFILAVIFRIISKVIFKTFFEERGKYYEHKDKRRKNRKTEEQD